MEQGIDRAAVGDKDNVFFYTFGNTGMKGLLHPLAEFWERLDFFYRLIWIEGIACF